MIDSVQIWVLILIALGDLGGRAKRARVFRAVEERFGHLLGPARELLDGRTGEPCWRIRVHAARKYLVDECLIEPRELSGHGIWALTPRGAAVAAHERTLMYALCPTFRSIASDVFERMVDGVEVGLVPGETTFTDNALLHLAVAQRPRIHIVRFSSHKEATNGADWEWWIRDGSGLAGFRVQAKRVDPATRRIALDQDASATARKRGHDKQIDVFISQCNEDGYPGLYCVYSAEPPPVGVPSVLAGPCPHGGFDPTQWGCAMLLATTARRLVDRGTLDAASALAAGWPWYHLVCDEGDSTVPTTHHVRALIGAMRDAERAARELPLENEVHSVLGPMPATDPPPYVLAHFNGYGGDFQHPRADTMAGMVLIDATG